MSVTAQPGDMGTWITSARPGETLGGNGAYRGRRRRGLRGGKARLLSLQTVLVVAAVLAMLLVAGAFLAPVGTRAAAPDDQPELVAPELTQPGGQPLAQPGASPSPSAWRSLTPTPTRTPIRPAPTPTSGATPTRTTSPPPPPPPPSPSRSPSPSPKS